MMYSYPSLRHNVHCDVLIIGGGLTGALMAFQLSQEGYDTVIIDKRDIGAGSTSTNTSMVQYEVDALLHDLAGKLGTHAAADIYLECVKAVYTLEEIIKQLPANCDFEFKESLLFATTPSDVDSLRHELESRKAAGIDVSWLTKDQIHSAYGLVSEGGILSRAGASLDVYQLTHTLLHHARKNYGLQIYDHTEAISIENTPGKSYLTVDSSAVITSRYIVYATGYETKELIGKDVGRLISTYACISEPVERLPVGLTNTIFWDTEDPYFYFRTTPDNRILIGGEDENFANPEKRDELIEKKEFDLVAKFRKQLPGIDFVPDFTWAGTFGLSKDTLPYVGPHPDLPNSFFVLAFGGNGITFSILAMKILSDALRKRKNKFLDYFKLNR
jgi:glycine/D-amino acid oxidase-like deaminating enzyme